VVVPPRDNALPWAAGHLRTRALADIAGQGLEGWKASSSDPPLSLAENAMYRLKQLFGGSVASRVFEAQVTEVHARIAALNSHAVIYAPTPTHTITRLKSPSGAGETEPHVLSESRPLRQAVTRRLGLLRGRTRRRPDPIAGFNDLRRLGVEHIMR